MEHTLTLVTEDVIGSAREQGQALEDPGSCAEMDDGKQQIVLNCGSIRSAPGFGISVRSMWNEKSEATDRQWI